MKLFTRLRFHSDGTSPLEVVDGMKKIGFSPVFGDYDFVIHFDDPEEYGRIVKKLHGFLKGKNVYYSLSTKKE